MQPPLTKMALWILKGAFIAFIGGSLFRHTLSPILITWISLEVQAGLLTLAGGVFGWWYFQRQYEDWALFAVLHRCPPLQFHFPGLVIPNKQEAEDSAS